MKDLIEHLIDQVGGERAREILGPPPDYTVFDWTERKHCEQARSYRDVSGKTRWTCKHEGRAV